jgi:23S rRNA (adenine2030-N6)-methyltransferase
VLLVEHLLQTDAAVCVIDTHAGQGRYDLISEAADKTGEFRAGIGRLLAEAAPPALARYAALVLAAQTAPPTLQIYPGSPALLQALLRPHDRLILMELHPEDAAVLRREFRADARVHVHERDGYEGLRAFVPPRERRGFVLIDPPYEAPDEMTVLVDALADAWRRWPSGQYALWYPIKERGAIDRFHGALATAGLRKLLVAEFLPTRDQSLRGSGMILVNPPWRIEDRLGALLGALGPALGRPDATARIDWLVPE